jgi:hypothetical protein
MSPRLSIAIGTLMGAIAAATIFALLSPTVAALQGIVIHGG